MVGWLGEQVSPARSVRRAIGCDAPTSHPFAPTEFPKGWSAAGGAQRPGALASGDIHPSRGGFQPPATPQQGGCELRMTPECLTTMLTIGQSSTDSSRARGAEPTGLREHASSAKEGFDLPKARMRAATRPSATVDTI